MSEIGHILNHTSEELEKALIDLPDEVADALLVWRTATLNREREEALLHAKLRARDIEMPAAQLKALINANDTRYEFVLIEIKAESEYNRKYEKLMGAKKIAALRVAV